MFVSVRKLRRLATEGWDDLALERFFRFLGPWALTACASCARRWAQLLAPAGRPWREALRQLGASLELADGRRGSGVRISRGTAKGAEKGRSALDLFGPAPFLGLKKPNP